MSLKSLLMNNCRNILPIPIISPAQMCRIRLEKLSLNLHYFSADCLNIPAMHASLLRCLYLDGVLPMLKKKDLASRIQLKETFEKLTQLEATQYKNAVIHLNFLSNKLPRLHWFINYVHPDDLLDTLLPKTNKTLTELKLSGLYLDGEAFCALTQRLPNLTNMCPKNEEFKCRSACQVECSTLGESCTIVNKNRNEACYYKEGPARNGTGTCVPLQECP
uniref:Uncharacterized protein n=1 Tax=Glossina palpalis gambiensis TaxID=67801 RepID=A0A1B0C3Z4_9MUSC